MSFGFDELIMFNILIKFLSEPFEINKNDINTNTDYNNFFINHIKYLIHKLKIDTKNRDPDNESTLYEILTLSHNTSAFIQGIEKRIEDSKQKIQSNQQPDNFPELITIIQQIFKKNFIFVSFLIIRDL